MRNFIIFTIQASLFLALNVSYAYTEEEYERVNSDVEKPSQTETKTETETKTKTPDPKPEAESKIITQKSPEECKALTLEHLKEQDYFKELFKDKGDNSKIQEIVLEKTRNATRRALLNLLENKRVKQSDSTASPDSLAQKIKDYEGQALTQEFKSLSPEDQTRIFDKFLTLSISESEEDFSESYSEIKNYISDILLLSESFNSINPVKKLSEMDRQLISIAFLHEKKKTDDSDAKSERMVLFETIKKEMEKVADKAAIKASEAESLKSEIPEIDDYRKEIANEYVEAVKNLFEDKDGVNKECKDYFSNYIDDSGHVVYCGVQHTREYDPFILLTKEVDILIDEYININENSKDQLFLDAPPPSQCVNVLKKKIEIKQVGKSKVKITVDKKAIEPGVEVFFEVRKKISDVKREKEEEEEEEEEDDEDNEETDEEESSPNIRKTKKYIIEKVASIKEAFDKELMFEYQVDVKCKNSDDSKARRIKRVKIGRCTSEKCWEEKQGLKYEVSPPPPTQEVTPPKTYMPFILSN